MKNKFQVLIFFTLVFTSACNPIFSTINTVVENSEIISAEDLQPVATMTPTREPNPYSLEGLALRSYGSGDFNVEFAWEQKAEFTRYKVNYDSDDLTIHGFVNIPTGKGPFPVVVALHGYIPAYEYETLDYSTRYADSIARKGYIVLHPNLRNFPPSDSVGRTRDYQSGYTIDVMNMLAHVERLAGEPGIFEDADLSRIGVWGHSLGGGTALRLVGLVDEIKAAVLYAAVSQRYTNRNTGIEIFDYENSSAEFSVHHGMDDEVISISSSQLLCNQLIDAGKEPECFYYEGQPHTFYRQDEGDALFIQRTIEFFDRHLKT
jgi:dipeptidyl aminopeptidase/acylaminoacyl peptidase